MTNISSKKENNFFNIMYLIIITMTTVGYGDFTATTYPGRCLIMFTALWGAFMISLVVLTVSNVLQLQKEQ